MRDDFNPFPINAYIAPEYFCDRKDETNELVKRIKNNIATTITAIRRIGKTGLMHHIEHYLPKNTLVLYIDLLPTEDAHGFSQRLINAIVQAVEQESSVGRKMKKTLCIQ